MAGWRKSAVTELWKVTAVSGPTKGIMAFTVRDNEGNLYTASCEGGGPWEMYNDRQKIPSAVEQVIIERTILQYLLDRVVCAK